MFNASIFYKNPRGSRATAPTLAPVFSRGSLEDPIPIPHASSYARVISIKVRRLPTSKKASLVVRSSSFVNRQSAWDKAVPENVERTAHLRPSNRVIPLNPPNLDRPRPVTADDPTPEWRINTDQCGYTVLMSLEQILLVVRDQAHSLWGSIAL